MIIIIIHLLEHFIKESAEKLFMNICFTKNYNLLVTYYFGKEIKILNCYNLEVVEDFYIYLPSFVENIENNNDFFKIIYIFNMYII